MIVNLDQELSEHKKERKAITFKAFHSVAKVGKKVKNKWLGVRENDSYPEAVGEDERIHFGFLLQVSGKIATSFSSPKPTSIALK